MCYYIYYCSVGTFRHLACLMAPRYKFLHIKCSLTFGGFMRFWTWTKRLSAPVLDSFAQQNATAIRHYDRSHQIKFLLEHLCTLQCTEWKQIEAHPGTTSGFRDDNPLVGTPVENQECLSTPGTIQCLSLADCLPSPPMHDSIHTNSAIVGGMH